MERYIKQIIFERIGERGQKFLIKSKVVLVGCGANGSIASELLTRAGIGELIIIDNDKIVLDNLQRQSLFKEKDVDHFKAVVAERELKEINSKVKITAFIERLEEKNLHLLSNSDLVLDCTDNFKTRFLINEYCVKNNIPWIFCAVLGSKGMTMNILPKFNYCLKCIFSEMENMPTADTAGIISSINHSTVAFMVTEALKILTKQEPSKDLVILDIWKQKIEHIKPKKNPKCLICLEGKKKV